MTPEAKRRGRRWLTVALLFAAWASPSASLSTVLLGTWGALTCGPAALRVWGGVRRLTHDAQGARVGRGGGREAGRSAVIGTDPAGRAVTIGDRELAAHALIVGASGAGKSTTLLALLGARIDRGDPVIAIDLKGSPSFAADLRARADRAGRGLAVFSPGGERHWNPLAHGNPTALKDKLISTERFSEPHYQRAAERYLQTALQVLEASHPGRAPTLSELVRVMEPRRLGNLLEQIPGPLAERAGDYLESLGRDGMSAIRGLGTRLALLSESHAGRWLEPDAPRATINLRSALHGGDVVLFSLNSSVYGKLAAQLGALAVQDLVSAAGERLDELGPWAPAVIALDEFSALGADNVLALLARGRESGMSVLLATQELADLERAGQGFRDQVLGITGIKIAHRQDVPASASLFAQMAGTHQVWERTELIRGPFPPLRATRGSRRQAERFLVHPNEIKTLATGQAVVLAKLPATRIVRVRVRTPERPAEPATGAAERPARLTPAPPAPARPAPGPPLRRATAGRARVGPERPPARRGWGGRGIGR